MPRPETPKQARTLRNDEKIVLKHTFGLKGNGDCEKYIYSFLATKLDIANWNKSFQQ